MTPSKPLASCLQQHVRSIAFGGVAAAATVLASPALVVAQEGDSEGIEQMPEEITSALQEEPEVNQAPPPDERRMYVLDAAAFDVLTKVIPIDGNTGAYLGTIDTGLLPTPISSPADGQLYISDTRYELYSRRNRDDFIAVYDPEKLEPQDLIDIPETRFHGMVHRGKASISQDGRYLFFYQFAPSNAIGIVDLEEKTFLNTIDTPQCTYAYAAGERRVAMRCRDASILLITFDENGEEVSRVQSDPIHEPVEQPTYNDPAYDILTRQMFLVSFDGEVFPVDLSGEEPKPGEPWDLLTEEQRKNDWAPGGWQPLDYHSQSKQLFVLMDRRAEWAHTSESREVWVYDTETQERVDTISLNHEAACIAVDRAEEPYLYALSSHAATLDIYDVSTGAQLHSVDELGHEPRLLVKNP